MYPKEELAEVKMIHERTRAGTCCPKVRSHELIRGLKKANRIKGISSFQIIHVRDLISPSTCLCRGSGPDLSKPLQGTKVQNILVLIVILVLYSRCVLSKHVDLDDHISVNSTINTSRLINYSLVYLNNENAKIPHPSREVRRRFVEVDDEKDYIKGGGKNKVETSGELKFTRSFYETTILEGSLPRTFLNTDEMMGVHLPSFDSTLKRFTGAAFHIIDGDDDKVFKAESKLVGDFAFLRLRTRSTGYMNREQRSEYNLTVGAKVKHSSKPAGGIAKQQSSGAYDALAIVLVTVLDSNDLGPMFDKSEYFATLPRHAPLHQEVIKVAASDSDLGLNSDIYYQIDDESRKHFAIHPNLGNIVLLKHARKLEHDYYEIRVVARDRGSQDHGHIGRTKVKIRVVTENRHEPVINVLLQIPELSRNIKGHMALGYLKISDADVGKDGEISSLFVNGSYKGDFFELQNVTGVDSTRNNGIQVMLTARSSMSVEDLEEELESFVTAVDGGSPPKSATIKIKFPLASNFNIFGELKPVSRHYSARKCNPIGSLIGHVAKHDSMDGVRYKTHECVSTNRTNNVVTNKECRRTKGHSLQCECSGFFTNLKSQPRKFNSESQRSKSALKYLDSSMDPSDYVEVHPMTGTIKIAKSFRHLPGSVDGLLILVRVEHPKHPPSLFSIFLRLDNCNDHGPTFDEPLHQQIAIKEDVLLKTVILRAHATDKDIGNGASIIGYSIFNTFEDSFTNSPLGGDDSFNGAELDVTDLQVAADNVFTFPFVIDHLTGEVYTAAPLDFDHGLQFYEFYLRASDAGTPYPRHTNSKPIRVVVTDINDNSPYFDLSKVTCFVSRSLQVGSLVTSVSANDLDTVGGPLTYEISYKDENLSMADEHDSVKNCFLLDALSGHLKLTCDLKEMTKDWFHLSISVSDGLHHSIDPLVIEIKVVESRLSRLDDMANRIMNSSDVVCEMSTNQINVRQNLVSASKTISRFNEKSIRRVKKFNHAPTIASHHPFHVRENSPRGAVFGKIIAFDPDAAYDGLLQYSILQGNQMASFPGDLKGWELFSIDVDNGKLKVAVPLDREMFFGAKNSSQSEISFDITTRICDMSEVPLCSEKIFQIFLDDVNDNQPEFERSLYVAEVREDVDIGHFILRISADDRDSAVNANLTYSLRGTNYFSVHTLTGDITTSLRLDREFMDKHEFKAVAKDSSGDDSLATEVQVIVMIKDVNDNRPTFLKESFKFQILEDLPLNSVVGVVQAIDPDIGEGGEISYQLEDTEIGREGFATLPQAFCVDSSSGAVVLRGSLQAGNVYSFKVKAIDKGRPPLRSKEAFVQVWVVPINRNRHAPAFKDFVRECFVRENLPPGSSVVQLQAVDMDSFDPSSPPENYKVEYSVRSGTGLGYFIVDSRGIIRTSQTLDREETSRFWLTIYAQDGATTPLGSSIHLLIRVLDENDNRPIFNKPIYRFSVAENSPPRTWVGQVEASDADLTTKTGLSFHFLTRSNMFSIDRKIGVIRTASRLPDREVKEEYRIGVVVRDNSDDHPLSSTTIIIITIIDQNDNPPRFFDSPYLEIFLPVFLSPDGAHHRHRHHHQGHHIQQALYNNLIAIQAYDMDKGINAEVEYSFEVNSGDFTAYNEDDFNNDNAKLPSQTSSSSSLLKIHSKSGELTISRSLEDGEKIHLQVIAKDKGQKSLNSGIKVTIEGVTIRSSQTPRSLRFIDDSCGRVHILEGSPPNDMVCLAVAKHMGGKDDDKGAGKDDSDPIWYYIAAGNEGNFGINWKVGSLRQVNELNRSSRHTHNLTIAATDGFTVITMQSIIIVVDINDHDPRFRSSKYHFNFTGNPHFGQDMSIKIGQVKATDEDDYDDGRLIYGITNVIQFHDDDLFLIDAESGAIFFNFQPNFNMFGCHTIVVEAKNRPSTLRPIRQDCTYVMICINNSVPDNRAPEFTSFKYGGQVEWWKWIGDEVLKVKAMDWDLGSNGEVRYVLISGNELFSLDSYTGSLILSSPISHHHLLTDGDIFFLTIAAIDSGQPELSSTCSVEIDLSLIIQSQDLRFEMEGYIFEVSENARPGSFVGYVATQRSGFRVLYELECFSHGGTGSSESQILLPLKSIASYYGEYGMNNQCMFNIDALSGVVTTLKSLDREVMSHHLLKITASVIGAHTLFHASSEPLPSTSTSSKSTSLPVEKVHTLVDIIVKDENDNTPQFRFSNYHGQLYESSETSQYVLSKAPTIHMRGWQPHRLLVFEAADLDAGQNAVVGIKIVEEWANKLFQIVLSESSIITKIPLDREAILLFQELYGGVVEYFDPDEFESMKISHKEMALCPQGSINKSIEAFIFDSFGFHLPCYSLQMPINWPSFATLKFKIEVFDHGRPQLASRAEVIVEVHDVNNKPPMFLDEWKTILMQPPLIPGFKIAHFEAVDLDYKNSSLKYFLDFNGGDNETYSSEGSYFHLDKSTGWLTSTQMLCNKYSICLIDENSLVSHKDPKRAYISNRDHNSLMFMLRVKVTDGTFFSSTSLVLKIVNTFYYPNSVNLSLSLPKFHGFPYKDLMFETEAWENTSAVQFLTRLEVSSLDLTPDLLTFLLLNHDDLFMVQPHSGIVETRKDHILDRELTDKYNLLVDVRHQDLSHVTRCLVRVKVMDTNDNPPLFLNLPYIVTVDVKTSVGGVIFQPIVKDFDDGPNSEISFSLISGDSAIFNVNKKTGQINLARQADNLIGQQFVIIIKAEDGGSPSLSSEVDIMLYFIGDSHPHFNPPILEFEINSNHLPLTNFASVHANSLDGAKLIYTIEDDDDDDDDNDKNRLMSGTCPFDVDLESGSLMLLSNVTHMAGYLVGIIIKATDTTSGLCGYLRANIRILGNVKESPVFDKIVYEAFLTPFFQEGHVIIEPKIVNYNLNESKLLFRLIIDPFSTKSLMNQLSDLEQRFLIDHRSGSVKAGKVINFEQLCAIGRVDFLISVHDLSDPTLNSSSVISLFPSNEDNFKIKFNSKDYKTKLEIPSMSNSKSEARIKTHFLEIPITKVSASLFGYCSCVEGSSSQEIVYSLVGDSPTYHLKNRKLYFSMDHKTGIVKAAITSSSIKTSSSKLPHHLLFNVTASTSFGLLDFTQVQVELTTENLWAPRFNSHLYVLYLNDSLLPGSIVLETDVTDEDCVDDDDVCRYEKLNFEIESNEQIHNHFHIDSKGHVYVKKNLMELSKHEIQFYIKVTDQDGLSSESKVVVKISKEQILKKILLLDRSLYDINVGSNTSIGSVVFMIIRHKDGSHSEEDSITEKVQFSLLPENCLSDNEGEYFAFDAHAGSLTLARSLSLLEKSSFSCFMRLSTYVTVQFIINVIGQEVVGTTFGHLSWMNNTELDVMGGTIYGDLTSHQDGSTSDSSHHLEFELDYYVFYIAENLKPGIDVGHITLRRSFPDGCIRFILKGWSNQNLSWNINDFFILNEDTGIITSTFSFDFESIPCFDFYVAAFDTQREVTSRDVHIHINIINTNDNSPTFLQHGKLEIFIKEDASPGLIITKFLTLDLDSSSVPIFFIKEGNPCGKFDLSATGELTLIGSLDREATSKYEFQVVAFDGIGMAETSMEINVLDVNDNSPSCREIPYQVSLMENADVGTTFLQIMSSDLDGVDSDESDLIYNIEMNHDIENYQDDIDQSLEPINLFSLNETNGQLSLKASLDRETKSKHEFWVRSTDKGGLFCRSKIVVTVEDMDDNPPRFLRSHFEGKVEENGAIGSVVMKVLAFDPDEGRNAMFHYYLDDFSSLSSFLQWLHSSSSMPTLTSSSYFTINPRTGIISTKVSFDRELESQYNATVYAIALPPLDHRLASKSQPSTSVPLWSSASVTIRISDVNDNPPVFAHTTYTFRVPEDAAVGTIVGAVTAVSIDEGLNALITYAIVNFDPKEDQEHHSPLERPGVLFTCRNAQCGSGLFAIDSKTGQLKLKTSMDYEKVKNYHFMVMAYDSGSPPLSSVTKVMVAVDDINDNAPLILQEWNLIEVYENVTVGSTLLQVSALDKDSGTNGMVRFKIASGNYAELFLINETTGVLSVSGPLDREKVVTWSIEVAVYDLGVPSLTSYSTIQVIVMDVNDCPPKIVTSKGFHISEQTRPGKSLIQLLVEDCDEEPNSFPFKYEIIHVGHDQDLWFKNCMSNHPHHIATHSHSSTGHDVKSISLSSSSEDVFIVNSQSMLCSTSNTIPYLKNSGLFLNESGHAVSRKTSLVIKVTDNGLPPLFSCALIPISLKESFDQKPRHDEKTSDMSMRLKPFKVLLYLLEIEDDLILPSLELGQIKATIEIRGSNSSFILSSDQSDLFDITYWIFDFGQVEDCTNFYKNVPKIHKIFQIGTKSGIICSIIPLDPGIHKFKLGATLTMNKQTKDNDDEASLCGTGDGSVVVKAVPVASLQEAVMVTLTRRSWNAEYDPAASSFQSEMIQATLGFLEVVKQRKELEVKVFGLNCEPGDVESRLRRSSTSSTSLRRVEILLSASNHGKYLHANELGNILHEIKDKIDEEIGWEIVNITQSGDIEQLWLCEDKKPAKYKCNISFKINRNSSLQVEFGNKDSITHIQIVPKFMKETSCLGLYGGTVDENNLCPSEKFEKTDKPDEIDGNMAITFNGQSFFAWHVAMPLERRLFISFDIKTNQTSGRILHLAGPVDYSFLEIELSCLQFRWNFGSGPGKVRIQGKKVSDGAWHHVALERSGINVRLVLDFDLVLDAVASGKSDVLNLEDNTIIIGGEVDHVDRMNVRFGFIGCLKNIVLNEAELIFNGSSPFGYLVNMMNINHGCDVGSFPDVCTSKPCLNGGLCTAINHQSFACKCTRGFRGRFCERSTLPYDSAHPCFSSSANPCLNSGACEPMTDMQYKCSCMEDYYGVHCETSISKEMETNNSDPKRPLVSSQNSFHFTYLLIFFVGITLLIAIVIIIIIVCLHQNRKKKKDGNAHKESSSNNQTKINNMICQLKKNDVNTYSSSHNVINNDTRDSKNANNSNNHHNLVHQFLNIGDRENDGLELEPLKGFNVLEKIRDQSLFGHVTTTESEGYNSRISGQGRELDVVEKTSHPISPKTLIYDPTDPAITINLCQGHLDMRTLSENVINFGSFKKPSLNFINKGRGAAQVSTPAKLHLTSEEDYPKYLRVFNTKESLSWDSQDLKPNSSSQQFPLSSGLSSEDEEIFYTTLKSEQPITQQNNDDYLGLDKNQPLLAGSAGEIRKADLKFYTMTFDTSSIALNDSQ